MDKFLYAMNTSFENMKKEIHDVLNMNIYTDKEENRIFFVVSSCLHYILDYAERVNTTPENKSFLSAFRYANNSLKHSIEVKEITNKSEGFSFPISFPLEIPERNVTWRIVDNGNKENQMNNYKKYLEGKDVIDTCEKIINILRNTN